MRLLRAVPLENFIVAFPTTFMKIPDETRKKMKNATFYYWHLRISRLCECVYILPNKYFGLKNVSTTWPLSDWPLVITRSSLSKSNKISHFTLSVGIISNRLCEKFIPQTMMNCNIFLWKLFRLFIGFMWWNVYSF